MGIPASRLCGPALYIKGSFAMNSESIVSQHQQCCVTASFYRRPGKVNWDNEDEAASERGHFGRLHGSHQRLRRLQR